MKLARFTKNGKIGLAVSFEQDFHAIMEDDLTYPGDLDVLVQTGARGLDAATIARWPKVALDGLDLLPPLGRPDKILCVGLNYADHAAETRNNVPAHPVFFTRYPSSFVGGGQSLCLPKVSEQFDFEGEIAVVIGQHARDIHPEKALDYIFGYTLANDATLRDYQKRTSQWTLGKNFDFSGSMGPYVVTKDELPHGIAGLRLQTLLNGQLVQDASTDDMIFPVARLLADLSRVMALHPGDVIVTGTPAGVGMGRTPPLWMRAGDRVEVRAEVLGSLRNTVASIHADEITAQYIKFHKSKKSDGSSHVAQFNRPPD